MSEYFKDKKPYTRPKDWERTIKRSYSDPDKDYEGKRYEDYDHIKEERKREKAKKEAERKPFSKILDLIYR
jgi:hypothetical protein